MRSPLTIRLGRTAAAAALLIHSSPVYAFEFGNEKFQGAFDTTLSYGAIWRAEGRDPALVGTANGGTAYSVNGDDGNLNYDTGIVSHVVKMTNDLSLGYRNFSTFFRATSFYDFESKNKNELTEEQRDRAGRDARLLDAYIQGVFKPFNRNWAIRAGKQVVSWGESTYIQNGINVINPVDLTKLRTPGSELREALVPTNMIWSSLELTRSVNVEGFYENEWDRIELDTCGTYFSTSDVGCEEGPRYIYAGFGQVPEGVPAASIRRVNDRDAKSFGQWGGALNTLLPDENNTELNFYFMNYHSRVPFLSATRSPGAPGSSLPVAYFEYPEDIRLMGTGFNTELGASGLAFQAEYSHRMNQPIAIDGTEVLMSAQGIPSSQIGAVAVGQRAQGYRRKEVGQLQGTLTKSFGPRNPFAADQMTMLVEAGATKIFGMEDPSHLRYEAPDTDLPGTPGVSALGTSTKWPSSFSWGYVVSANTTFNHVVGPVNLTPAISFSHDVNGTTPSPIGTFVEGRKAFTASLRGDYLSRTTAEVGYTMFYGGGNANLLHDRDFISANVKYSF